MFQFVNWPTRYDNREAAKALKGSGIEVPRLESYAAKLWDYWERNLDPDLFIDRSLSGRVKGKVVVVTGSSSGIGRAAALKLADAGAKVMLVARGEEKLRETKQDIDKAGGKAWIYTADISDMASCDALVARVLKEHGRCDFLVNNAGRSIRRGVVNSFDRFHDFERTMQLNYFGSLRLIMGFLPGMLAQKRGHIINISSIGVLVERAAILGVRRVEVGARFVLGLRGLRVPRQGNPLHDDQHAARAHADDRAHEDLRQRADALAGAGRRSGRRGDRLQAGADRDAPRRVRRGVPRDRAEAHADPAQHRVQHVPRFSGGAGQERGRERRLSSPPSRWRSPRSRRGFTGSGASGAPGPRVRSTEGERAIASRRRRPTARRNESSRRLGGRGRERVRSRAEAR